MPCSKRTCASVSLRYSQARRKKSVSDIFHAAKITLTATTLKRVRRNYEDLSRSPSVLSVVPRPQGSIIPSSFACLPARPPARSLARGGRGDGEGGRASLQAAAYNAIKSLARALSRARGQSVSQGRRSYVNNT